MTAGRAILRSLLRSSRCFSLSLCISLSLSLCVCVCVALMSAGLFTQYSNLSKRLILSLLQKSLYSAIHLTVICERHFR